MKAYSSELMREFEVLHHDTVQDERRRTKQKKNAKDVGSSTEKDTSTAVPADPKASVNTGTVRQELSSKESALSGSLDSSGDHASNGGKVTKEVVGNLHCS